MGAVKKYFKYLRLFYEVKYRFTTCSSFVVWVFQAFECLQEKTKKKRV